MWQTSDISSGHCGIGTAPIKFTLGVNEVKLMFQKRGTRGVSLSGYSGLHHSKFGWNIYFKRFGHSGKENCFGD